MPGVVTPDSRLIFRREWQRTILVQRVGDFGHLAVGVGVGRRHFQVVGDIAHRFQLEATHFCFAQRTLHAKGIAEHDVATGQVVRGRSEDDVAARRLVFEAHFVLLARPRLKRYAIGAALLGLE